MAQTTGREAPRLPGGLPLAGHILPFLRNPVRFLLERHTEHGDAIRFTLLGKDTVSFCGPEANTAVLGCEDALLDRRSLYRRHTTPLFGPDVAFAVAPEVMTAHRTLLPPTLQRTAMGEHTRAMARVVQRYTEAWGDSGTIDLVTACREMTARISALCPVGPRFEREVGPRLSRLLGCLESSLSYSFALGPRTPLPVHLRRDRARDILLQAIKTIAPHDSPGGVTESPYQRILRTELPVGTIRSGDTAAALMLSWLFAANETTAVHGAWTGVLLLLHPRWLPVLRAEQAEVLSDDQELCPPLVHRMRGLQNCMREAERLHPSVPVFLRTAAQDVRVHGHDAPRGAVVLLSPAASHRLPGVFPDPHVYDPDRYLPGHANETLPQGALIGFSGGQHPCLGMSFAQHTVAAIWSHLLRTFELRLSSPGERTKRNSLMAPPRQLCLVRYQRRPS